jgi:hypothetical protein
MTNPPSETMMRINRDILEKLKKIKRQQKHHSCSETIEEIINKINEKGL